MENQDFFELLTDKIINQIKEYILCHYPSIYIEEVISFMTLLIDDAYLLEDASVYENLYFEAVAKKCVPEALFDIREDLQEFHQTVKEKYDIELKHNHLIDDSLPEIIAKFYYDYDYYGYKDAFDNDSEAYQSFADALNNNSSEELEEIYSYILLAASQLKADGEYKRALEADMIYKLLKGREATLNSIHHVETDDSLQHDGQRYIAIMGFNTKQWWVYDEETGNYIDPPSEILNEVKNSSQDIDEQQEHLNQILSSEPEWLNDKEYIYEDDDYEI